MTNRQLFPLLFLLTFHCFCTIAQTDAPKPLPGILKELQERFGVKFNYASRLIDEIAIPPPNTSLKLEESLEYISRHSKLDFVVVTDGIISVSKERIRFCGYLRDKDTGETLPYVTIEMNSTGTITNEAGFFEFEGLQESDLIRIGHIGYKPLDIPIKSLDTKRCITWFLIPDQERLAEVTVYDFLIRGIDKLDNGSFQIDFDRFSILPGLVEDDVLLSVQALPGIQSIDETVSNINIRGGSNDQNLITWDGIKMYQSGHFFGLISMYNPHITQKVELRKNGSSATETDGVSGTISMKTDDDLSTRLKGIIGVNFLDINGSVDTPLGEKASIQVAARKSVSDLVETPTYSEYFNRISQDTELERLTAAVTNSDVAFDFYDASFRLLFHPSSKDRLRINFIHTANNVSFNENASVSGSLQIRQSNLSQNSIAEGLQYIRDWTDAFGSEIALYNSDYKLKAINANILEDQRFLQENKVSETGLNVITRNKITPHMDWINGYHFVETKVTNLDDVDDPVFIRLEGEVLRTHAVSSQTRFSSQNAATLLNLGLRINYLEEFNKQLWEPRISFNHAFHKNFDIEVLGEFKHQNTSQIINFQNDFLGIEKRRWQLSNNQSIPVITSKQVSLGLNFTKKSWLVSSVAYYKHVDGITTQSQGFQDRYAFVKTSGSYNARGIDLLLRKQFENQSIWVSYAYLKSDYLFKNLPEVSFPNNFDITHALTMGINYSIGRLLIATGINWHTGKPFTRSLPGEEVVDGAVNYDIVNGERLDDYIRLDLSAKYEFDIGNKTKIRIGASVWNALNRNNTINSFYRLLSLQDAQKTGQSSLGITPNVSFNLLMD